MACNAAQHLQWAVNLTLGLPAITVVVYAVINAALMNYRRTTD